MGLCESAEELRQKRNSRRIDEALRLKNSRLVLHKILFLGPGESGKSTFLKQMQIIHLNGFSEEEIHAKNGVIYNNVVDNILDIVKAMPNFELELENKELEKNVTIIEEYNTQIDFELKHHLEHQAIKAQVAEAIKQLWEDSGVQKCFEHRNEYHLNDSALYFFENIDRISDPNYKPTNQDILCSRQPTESVVQLDFELKGIMFNVIDVGGQRSQRKKWIHLFDNVNSIIFVAAISEYDQTIREDDNKRVKKNRLMEAIDLFAGISTSPYFLMTNTILFLNKKDIFEEKIKKVCLSTLFPKYSGGQNYNNAINYLEKKFYARKGHFTKSLYIHVTCATDTDLTKTILNDVLDMILEQNMKNLDGPNYDKAVWYIEKKFFEKKGHFQKNVYIHHTCAIDTNLVAKIFDNVMDMILQKNIHSLAIT